MMLVNHRVVVTQEQLNMLVLAAEPQTFGENWMHDESVAAIYAGWPVLVAPEDGTPVDCGDGWLACYKFESLYAWNYAQLKADTERAAREAVLNSRFDEGGTMGLFQQRPGGWDIPLVEPRPRYSFGDFGGIS